MWNTGFYFVAVAPSSTVSSGNAGERTAPAVKTFSAPPPLPGKGRQILVSRGFKPCAAVMRWMYG